MPYRSVNFRDAVLWELARRVGLDPTTELLVDQARSFVGYINALVRKEWDAQDWPEWTDIAQFTPDNNHIVPYQLSVFPNQVIGRVWKMYLVDPNIFSGILSSPFFLRVQGVHCGFEHGTNVWLKYIVSPPPQFTSDEFDPTQTYNRGDLTYSPVDGETFMSTIDGQTGVYPVLPPPVTPPHLPPTNVCTCPVTMPCTPPPRQANVYTISAPPPGVSNPVYKFIFTDQSGGLHYLCYSSPCAQDSIQFMGGLRDAINMEGAADPFFLGVTTELDVTNGVPTLILSTADPIDLQAMIVGTPSTPTTPVPPPALGSWALVPFPFALVDRVLRGAMADALRELGQNEKAMPEEQASIAEAAARAGAYIGPPFNRLSDQQQPRPMRVTQ
jgi:hypothetical protein